MKLSDMKCKTAKTKEKPYKISDGGGLYLEVTPNGTKLWRLKYRIHGVEKRLALGKYPEVSLLDVRRRVFDLKDEIRQGIDPALTRQQERMTSALAQNDTFERIAMEWYEKQVPLWKPQYAAIVKYRFEKYVFTVFGKFPVRSIKPIVMLNCLQKIEQTAPDMSRRIKAYCSHVFKYAIATDRAENDPTYGLETALKKFKKGHYASVTVDEFPKFLYTMHEYRDRINRQTYLGLRMLLLTFVRTNELVEAVWSEIDFDNAMWIIPANRMKMTMPHMVPLSRQSIVILKELKQMNGHREYVFPSYYRPKNPMCKNTMLAAIKRMGYNGRMTGHGFRALALGLLKEKLGYSHELADRQLAHVPKNSVDRAYDRAQFLPQRVNMMQNYADYLDRVYIDTLKSSL